MATVKTTEDKPLPTVQEIAEGLKTRFIECAAAAANEADVNQVMNAVIKDLNAAKREVTLKMMGLDNRWGNWEVDRSNGRNSPIVQYLNEECDQMIGEWVRTAVKEVLTEELRGKMKKEIDAAFRNALRDAAGYRLRSKIDDHVESFVSDIIKAAANELREELQLNK